LGIINAVLVGDKQEIKKIAAELGIDLSRFEIIDEKDDTQASRKAVELVSSGNSYERSCFYFYCS